MAITTYLNIKKHFQLSFSRSFFAFLVFLLFNICLIFGIKCKCSQGIQGIYFVKYSWQKTSFVLSSQDFLDLFFLGSVQGSFKMRTNFSNLLYFWCLIIFVLKGWHKGQPYTKDAKVKSFIQWMKSQSEADQIKKTVIGGYYPFPRPPDSFLKYCKNNEGITHQISVRFVAFESQSYSKINSLSWLNVS